MDGLFHPAHLAVYGVSAKSASWRRPGLPLSLGGNFGRGGNFGTVTYAKAGSSNAAAVGTLVAVAD